MEVFEEISGLKSSTIYHARLVASSEGGTATGQDVSFTTMAAEISTKYLRDHTREVVKRAKAGESFTVKIDGTPAAEISAYQPTLLTKLRNALRR